MSLTPTEIRPAVQKAVGETSIWDLHTHLYPPSFGTPFSGAGDESDPDGLMLWGIDELLTYHYLIAEVLRAGVARGLTPKRFFSLSTTEQADLIWQELFVDRTPLSEACRGVVTTLSKLGLDPNEQSLAPYRSWFADQTPEEQIDRVLDLAGVDAVTMTNDLFDPNERSRWLTGVGSSLDDRFPAVLRFDQLVVDFPAAAAELSGMGYTVDAELSAAAVDEARRCLDEWIERTQPVYCAMSLPPEWRYPDRSPGGRCLTEVILPTCAEHRLPLALMIGVTRQVNPAIRLAGDSVGSAHVPSLAALCRDWPDQRFLVTILAREDQHELAVTARKFANLTPFGCWWFLNNPSLIEEITRMRLELLGPTFVPQHSDCRVLEQLIYKWDHSRTVIADVLADHYERLVQAGLVVDIERVRRDADRLLRGNVAEILGR